MLKLLTILAFTSLVACGSSGSSASSDPVPSQATCLSLNTLTAQSPTVTFTTSDQVQYQINYRTVTVVGIPGVAPPNGTYHWGSCQIQVNQGTFLSSTWN